MTPANRFKFWDFGFNWDVAPLSISLLWTAKMPVPQENLLFVEQASCLFLRMVQDVRFNKLLVSRSG